MKTVLKLISFFVFVMLMNSCSNDKNTLTESYILQRIAEKEAQNPIVFKTTLSTFYIKSVNDISNGIGYYSKLYNDGFLSTELRTDIPNPTASPKPYKVICTQAAAPFTLEVNPDGFVVVKTLEFNAVAVKAIRILSDFKAEVDVVFKKTKTPFYNPETEDIAPSGKEYADDSYIKTLEFRKNTTTNEWKHPIKIMF